MPARTVHVSMGLGGGGFRNQHEQHCPDLGPACDSMEVTPYRHDLKIETADLSLSAQWGVARGVAVEALVPLRLNRQQITFRTLEGVPFTPDPPDFHHTNRTLTGLADPWLLVATGTQRGGWTLGARAGVSLPLGSTVENPFVLGEEGLPHEHVQMGSGTVQPIASLGLVRAFDGWAATAQVIARWGVWTNQDGYRAGDQMLGQIYASSSFGIPRTTLSLGPTLYGESTETWAGHVESEGNLGRTDLYAEARAAHAAAKLGVTLGGELRVPLWGRATGAQLDVPVSFRVFVARDFGEPTP